MIHACTFYKTRLPSNLRPSTHECTHFVMRGHFRSHDKDGSDTIRSAVPENPCCTQTSRFYDWSNGSYCRPKFYIAEIGIFDFFWLLWPWPWPNDLHIWTRPVDRGHTLHMQIWISYIKAFESCCPTDRHVQYIHTDIHAYIETDRHDETNTHTASWVVKMETKF